MSKCNHSLGMFSTMKTLEVTEYEIIRRCQKCRKVERLARAGKIYVGVNVAAESKRDFDRRKYAKDLLQAYDVDGKPNQDFVHAYGDPAKRGKAKKGRGIDRAIKRIQKKHGK